MNSLHVVFNFQYLFLGCFLVDSSSDSDVEHVNKSMWMVSLSFQGEVSLCMKYINVLTNSIEQMAFYYYFIFSLLDFKPLIS